MKKTVLVATTIHQFLEVPEGTTSDEILEFLATNQSFRNSFVGLEADDMKISDLIVVEEKVAK